MVFSIKQKKAENQQIKISARDAFNLWDILRSKYVAVEHLQIGDQSVHDIDLKLINRSLTESFIKNIQILENALDKYLVKSPTRNKEIGHYPLNTKFVDDQDIAGDTFFYIQEHVENLLRALRTSVTNDDIGYILKQMTLRTIDESTRYIKFMKAKGWAEVPPLYKKVSPKCDEEISTPEVANLWDMVTFRYDNLALTQIYYDFIHDGEFKIIISTGMKKIKKQLVILEKELRYFGIPFPKRPPKIVPVPQNTETMDDDSIYRSFLIGFQGALVLHAESFKQSTFNDRIRTIFMKLLIEEIDVLDDFHKYGKIKGWLNTPPGYGSQ